MAAVMLCYGSRRTMLKCCCRKLKKNSQKYQRTVGYPSTSWASCKYCGWNYYTLQCGTIMTLISPGDCTLQCGMWLWNRDSEFTKWQHPPMWYVALGWHTVEFARRQHPAMWHWDHDIEFARWKHPAMWQVALGWHVMEFAQTFAILEFYVGYRFWPYNRSRHVILHQSAKFYSNRTILRRKRWHHVDFQNGGSQPTWILGSNNRFFEKPM